MEQLLAEVTHVILQEPGTDCQQNQGNHSESGVHKPNLRLFPLD